MLFHAPVESVLKKVKIISPVESESSATKGIVFVELSLIENRV
jgi:hypothetical protein